MSTTTAPPARLKTRYLEEIRPALIERFGYSSVMQAPQDREDHAEHGRRHGQAGLESAESRAGAACDDRRPAAEHSPRAQVDRRVQTARGHARRRRGDAARRAQLRVPRSPRLDRDSADPRLPRPEPALVRRARQLLAGRARADHLPRDRLRRDRSGARPGHHDHDDRRHRHRGVRAPAGARPALRRARAPGRL